MNKKLESFIIKQLQQEIETYKTQCAELNRERERLRIFLNPTRNMLAVYEEKLSEHIEIIQIDRDKAINKLARLKKHNDHN